MRQLRFVRSADDGNHLIVETADGAEQFSLLVTPAVRDAARSDLPRLTSRPAVAEEPSSIGPREIQMRVRAGESPQELAEANEMSLERVLRFAEPVLAERGRITDEARRARARRSTTDGQTVVFGEAVDERFAAHGIDPVAVAWDARRREDGVWIISARWLGGDADRLAEWTLQLATRFVAPLDDTAADLLSDRPIRPIITAASGPIRPNLSSAPPLAPGVVAFPVMPDARTGPLPAVRDDVFDQDAHDPDLPRNSPVPGGRAPLTSAPAAGPGNGSAPDAETASYDALPLELPGIDPARLKTIPQRVEESEEERAERARIPSWDDILLGVRRKSD